MAHRILIFLLLTIPLSFKIEIFPGIRLLLQEPFLILFCILCNSNLKKVNTKAIPFLFLGFSLLVILVSSIVSLLYAFDLVGTIKTLKYLLYAFSVFTVLNNSKYINKALYKKILNIGFLVVLISLSLYIYWFFNLGKSWAEYVSYTTWKAEYMPTGLSNTVFDLKDFTFKRIGGNHGIYGSYLVLILILAINNLLETNFYRSKLLSILIIVNISFITSRETLLLLFLTLFFYVTHYLFTRNVLKKNIVLFSFITVLGLIVILFVWSPDLVILNKINHMLTSFQEKGGFDNNVNYRFNTWYLFFLYAFSHPWILVTGVGYNRTNFSNILDQQEAYLNAIYPHVDVPESFYVAMLAYGGIISLVLGLMFFITFFYLLYKAGKKARFLSFFVLGLMITNATGASILAELLISQLGITSSVIMNYKRYNK